jgi:hypothetical protein
MTHNRNQLYAILLIACASGYSWLFYNLTDNTNENSSVTVCLFKKLTSIPCPSCGTTRSVVLLSKGNFSEALFLNPLGYLAAFLLLIIPFWISIDIVRNRISLLVFYQKTETYLKKTTFAIPLLVLVVINWIWNIIKGL